MQDCQKVKLPQCGRDGTAAAAYARGQQFKFDNVPPRYYCTIFGRSKFRHTKGNF